LNYISTRGRAPILDFEQATLAGLAQDGGLYLPSKWPSLSRNNIRELQGKTYSELATKILGLFVGNTISTPDLERLSKSAYSNFNHDAIAPLKQLDDQLFFMELFHGPTLAFKDYALQMLGQFFAYFLDKNNASCTIIGATSGDTGSAAIAGVKGLKSIRLFMLHPSDRVSEVQRKQMTTVLDDNIHNLAVDGTFDDCQNLVKALFNDSAFRERHSLSAVNSINWARIAAQVVYYFRAALALGAPDREVNFSVPTGNFGNVLAGYVAKQMGLPIHRLIIGSNQNDILTRFFETGVMEMRGVTPTLSPSMDIQISSNFERYLFELLDHDSDHLESLMSSFGSTGRFSIDRSLLAKAQQHFSAYCLDDAQTAKDIKQTYRATGEIIDPHSIIGVSAARREPDSSIPTVVLGTAHPAKFPEAIKLATGLDVALPAHMGDLMGREEKMLHIDNEVGAVKSLVDSLA
jgi:threonine synthase